MRTWTYCVLGVTKQVARDSSLTWSMRLWPGPPQDIDSPQLNPWLLSRVTDQAQTNSVGLSPHLPGLNFSISSATARRQVPPGCTPSTLHVFWPVRSAVWGQAFPATMLLPLLPAPLRLSAAPTLYCHRQKWASGTPTCPGILSPGASLT